MGSAFLGLGDDPEAAREKFAIPLNEGAEQTAESVRAFLESSGPASTEEKKLLLERVANRQQEVEYTGDVESWLELVAPKPL